MTRLIALIVALAALVLGGFFDGHIAQAAPSPAASQIIAKNVHPLKSHKVGKIARHVVSPHCFSDPSGSFCMSCFYVSGTLRCYWTGLADSAAPKGFSAVAPDDYNMDPGSGSWYWFRRDYLPCGPPWAVWSKVIYQAYADPYQQYYITQRCDF